MFTAKNSRLKKFAEQAGIQLTDEIEFFGELVAEECADIAETVIELNLPPAPIIRRHFSLLERKN